MYIYTHTANVDGDLGVPIHQNPRSIFSAGTFVIGCPRYLHLSA